MSNQDEPALLSQPLELTMSLRIFRRQLELAPFARPHAWERYEGTLQSTMGLTGRAVSINSISRFLRSNGSIVVIGVAFDRETHRRLSTVAVDWHPEGEEVLVTLLPADPPTGGTL